MLFEFVYVLLGVVVVVHLFWFVLSDLFHDLFVCVVVVLVLQVDCCLCFFLLTSSFALRFPWLLRTLRELAAMDIHSYVESRRNSLHAQVFDHIHVYTRPCHARCIVVIQFRSKALSISITSLCSCCLFICVR